MRILYAIPAFAQRSDADEMAEGVETRWHEAASRAGGVQSQLDASNASIRDEALTILEQLLAPVREAGPGAAERFSP